MDWRQLILVSALTAASAATAASTPPLPVPTRPAGVCQAHDGDAAPERNGLDYQGAVGASQIWATPGRFACSEPAFGHTVDCFAGPGMTHVRIETGTVVHGFVLDAQEALRISPEGVTCSAPPDGPSLPVGDEPAPDMNDVHAAISAEAQRLYGADCGEVHVPERAIETVELTGGGHPEFAVFFSRVLCSGDGGPTTRWSGTGGAMVQFWLASGGPPRLLLEHSMLGFSPADAFAGLITHQHGGFCPDGAGPNICEVIYGWNDRDRALEVVARNPLEESAEIDRATRALRFSAEDVSRW